MHLCLGINNTQCGIYAILGKFLGHCCGCLDLKISISQHNINKTWIFVIVTFNKQYIMRILYHIHIYTGYQQKYFSKIANFLSDCSENVA